MPAWNAHGPVIRIGVGGWTYEPWRNGVFFPAGLPHKQELAFASRQLNSIEINGTFYGAQKPESFARWHDETPEDFVFAVKAPRFATNRRVLAEAEASITRFFSGGLMRLRRKLGPVNWQFPPHKAFDAADFAAFLRLLPHAVEGQAIRHALEVRHPSFQNADFVDMARDHAVAIVIAGDSAYPQIAENTAPFVYARIMGTEDRPNGYADAALAAWGKQAMAWRDGKAPGHEAGAAKSRKDVFLYVISGCKMRNPAAAMALSRHVAQL